MTEIVKRFRQMGVVPVVAIENAADALPLADALEAGGLPCAEITFRTEAAAEAMQQMAKRGGILVGAGTVLTVEQVKIALDAGAQFMVSPGFNPKVAAYCVKNDIACTPGVCTPSDIEGALELGIDVLKFFPAEAFGGLRTLKAMSGPYTQVQFIPTGGINPDNLEDYLGFRKVVACGGTWIAKSALITQGRFDAITANVKQALAIVKAVRAVDA